MFTNIKSVLRNVEDVTIGNIVPKKEEPISYFARWTKDSEASQVTDKKIIISKVFTLHDFNNGFIRVKYTFVIKKSNGEVLTAGYNINSTWIIHKQNGKWGIVKIYENP